MYTEIRAQTLANLEDVSEIAEVGECEPRSVPQLPYAWPQLMGWTRVGPGDGTQITYHERVRVLVAFAEDGSAEETVAVLINTVPAALEGPGCTVAAEGYAGFADIGERKYRAIDFTLDSLEWLADYTG